MVNKLMELLGNGDGQYSDKADPYADQVVPRCYGRVWVKPVLLLSRNTSSSWGANAPLGSDNLGTSGQSVDAIFALGQAGLQPRGVRMNGTKAGRYEVSGYQGSVAWTKRTEDPDPYYSLLCAFSGVSTTGGWVSGGAPGQNNAIYRYTTSFAPMEVLNGAGSPWGKRTTGYASVDAAYYVNGHVPQPAWTDITGTSMPSWAHLNASDAQGLTYSQLTTIRCEGVPLFAGRIQECEVQVDGIGGENCSPVVAVRDILINLMGIPADKVVTDKGPDGTAASSYEAWCTAMATTMAINAAIVGDPTDLLKDILTATCSEIVPLANGGVRVQPLGDTVVNGYQPATAAYVVDSSDIVGDVVECEERPQGECPNAVWCCYTDPSTPDTQTKVPWRDDFDIAATQLRKGPTISSKFITSAPHAKFVADFVGKRGLRNRRSWRFAVTARFLLLEQGDLLEVHDARIPVSVVRVVTRDIDPTNWSVAVMCEEWNGGTHPVPITPDLPAGLTVTTPSALEVGAIAATQSAAAAAASAQTAADSAASVAATVQTTVSDPTTGLAATADKATQAQTVAATVSTTINDPTTGLAAAHTKAGQALTLAGSKTAVTYSTTAPGSPATGDLWFSTNLTTNCPDTNCKGHTTDANGAVRTGNYPHRELYWQHRWTGSAWVDAAGARVLVASEIAAGAITADKIQAGTLTADNFIINSLTFGQHLTAMQISDLSNVLGMTMDGGEFVAVDSTGGNWLTYQGSHYLLNGNLIGTANPQHYGDAIWHPGGFFIGAGTGGGSGICTITISGALTTRQAWGGNYLAYNTALGMTVATPDSSPYTWIYYSSNGSSWSSFQHNVNVYWQGACSLEARGFLAVGQDASNNAVVLYSPNGTTTWSQCSLPSNTGGTVASGRTTAAAPSKGIIAGLFGSTVYVMTRDYLWTANVSSNLTLSASWTRSAAPFASDGAVPMKARQVPNSMFLALSFDQGFIGITFDGVNWRKIWATGAAGVTGSTVLAIGATQLSDAKGGRTQLVALMGTQFGRAAVVTSGIVNGVYT